MAAQHLGQMPRLLEPAADHRQVAGATPAKGQPRQGPVDIGDSAQRRPQTAAQGVVCHQMRDGRVARVDHRKITRGAGKPPFQQAPATRRQGLVDSAQQRPVAPAAHGGGQFQVAARCRVDLHRAAQRLAHGRAQQGHAAFLRDLEIVDKRPQRPQFDPLEGAETVQRSHGKGRTEPLFPQGRVETGAPAFRQRCAQVICQVAQRLGHVAGRQKLAHPQPRQFGRQPRAGAGHDPHLAGRDIGPGQRALAPNVAKGREVIVPARFEQAVLGQGARRDQTHHVARHHRFGPALFRLGRVFHLLGDGDAKALADQRQQIAFGAVDRHAAHGDILAQVLAALGQCDIQRRRGRDSIVKEHLVEIAHAIEQQRIRVLRLDLEVLRHHRRDGRHRVSCLPWPRLAKRHGTEKAQSACCSVPDAPLCRA